MATLKLDGAESKYLKIGIWNAICTVFKLNVRYDQFDGLRHFLLSPLVASKVRM